MAANTQSSTQLTSNMVVDEQSQQRQSTNVNSTKTSRTKVSKKAAASKCLAIASETTTEMSTKSTTTNVSTTENVSLNNIGSHSETKKVKTVESKKIVKQTIVTDSSEIKTNNDIDAPSENGVVKTTKQESTKSPGSPGSLANGSKKTSKKVKKSNSEKQNISVKSGFVKFDAIQKKNDKLTENKQECHVCQKEVFKMEEIKAEQNIYHKSCFRCHECEKQLKVDNYQSHEGVLYCKAHFKLLFMPKVIEETLKDTPRKPELIIIENQPIELPPDVIRASDKPDLGLEELQQINIRSKFEAFEKPNQDETEIKDVERPSSVTGVKRSASILSKLAKFQEESGKTNNMLTDIQRHDEESESDSSCNGVDSDAELVRGKGSKRERPVGLCNMNDIKSKFETGHIMSKEERREERKQEIQNIRSRLFMGKQARIKEMYQQAVAESEHGITSAWKESEIDIGDKARSLKEKFEKGEIFKEHDEIGKVRDDEFEVFESAISKTSRSLFQELDASAAKSQLNPEKPLSSSSNENSRNRFVDDKNWTNSNLNENVVKHDEKIDDVQVETSDISSKFKFFETYKSAESEKKVFRITPPRDGVAKLPSPEVDEEAVPKPETTKDDTEPLQKSQTTTKMLSKFRELEKAGNNSQAQLGPRPLKCFTPPPDDNRRIYTESESDESLSEEEEEDDDYYKEDSEGDGSDCHGGTMSHHLEDEALIQAQEAARAKQLRAKFEKWEVNEIQREIQNGTINLYEDNSEENQIESAKAIREKFENMKENQLNQPLRPRYRVNRFV